MRRGGGCASLPCGGPLPWLRPPPPFGWFLLPLIARLSASDHVAGGLGDADLASVFQHPESDLGGLLALRVDQHQVRDVDRRLLLEDAAGLAHAGRLGVT